MTTTETVAEALARLWRDEGDVESLGDDTDFFAEGGDSMGATMLAGALAETFAIAVDVAEIYRHPTFADQVALIASKIAASGSGTSQSDDRCPATQGQVGLFFRELLEQAGESVAVSRFVRAAAGFDDAVVEAAMARLIERHASLRTVLVPSRGGLALQVDAARDSYPGLVERIDGVFDAPDDPKALNPFRYRASHFDLKRAPLIHATVASLSDGSDILQLAVHHVGADGGSASVLVQEFTELYLGLLGSGEPTLSQPRPYLEFARRQLEVVASGGYEAGAATVAGLLDRHVARQPGPVDFGPGTQDAGSATDNLVVPVDPLGTNPAHPGFGSVMTAFAAAIARRTGRSEILFGVATALRQATVDVPLVGMYVNLVPVLVPVEDGRAFADQRDITEQALTAALQRADIPFELAMKQVGFRQPHAFYPFDFLLTEMRYPDRFGPGLEPVNIPAVRRVEMHCPSVIVRRCGDGVALVLEYSPRNMDVDLLDGLLDDARAVLARDVQSG